MRGDGGDIGQCEATATKDENGCRVSCCTSVCVWVVCVCLFVVVGWVVGCRVCVRHVFGCETERTAARRVGEDATFRV